MKITVNQLRRIIKEEVARAIVVENGDEERRERQRQLDIDAINAAIENLRNRLDKVSPVLRPGIESSIKRLEALKNEPDYETDYGTEEEEPYKDEEPYTDEDSMFESRGQKAKNRIETLESKIKKLEAKLEASKNKRKQTQEDEKEQEELEKELDKLHQELLVARDPSMKESRRRTLRKR